jgi:hypothetical protein
MAESATQLAIAEGALPENPTGYGVCRNPLVCLVRGLDLNLRSLGYEGKASRDTSQGEPRNADKDRDTSPPAVA